MLLGYQCLQRSRVTKRKQNSIKRAPRESTWSRLGPSASNQEHVQVEKLWQLTNKINFFRCFLVALLERTNAHYRKATPSKARRNPCGKYQLWRIFYVLTTGMGESSLTCNRVCS